MCAFGMIRASELSTKIFLNKFVFLKRFDPTLGDNRSRLSRYSTHLHNAIL